MDKFNASRHLALAYAAAALAVVIGIFWLVGAKKPSPAQVDPRTTTGSAAEAAGAHITPTEPKLRVEPK
jgi:hypothetical protein